MEVQYPDNLKDSYKIGLAIMVHNRSDFVVRCFEHLKKSDLADTIIVIIDDASEELETLEIVKDYSIPNVPIIKVFILRHQKFNIHENLKFCWDMLTDDYQCSYLAVLDSDAIVKPHWLKTLCSLYNRHKENFPKMIITGFNSRSHPFYERYMDYGLKKSVGGVNMFFDSSLYQTVVRPCLLPYWDKWLAEDMQENNYPYLVTYPSIVQHIGSKGLFSFGYLQYDYALDYSFSWFMRLLPCYIYQKIFDTTRKIAFFILKSWR